MDGDYQHLNVDKGAKRAPFPALGSLESLCTKGSLVPIGESLFTYFASLAYVPLFPTEKFNDQL